VPDGDLKMIDADMFQIVMNTGRYQGLSSQSASDCLDVAVNNFKPDNTGKSPFQQIFELVDGHYKNKEKTIT